MPILARRALGPGLSPFPRPFVCQSCQRSLRWFSVTSGRANTATDATDATDAVTTITTTSAATAIAPPPPSGYALLTSRRLISLAGPDAPRFLHGLITQPVSEEPGSGSARHQHNTPGAPFRASLAAGAPGFYSGFLNATGRVLHDAFVYRDTLGLSRAEEKAFIVEVDAAQVHTLAQHFKRYKLRSKLSFRLKRSIVLPDTRAPGMGYRVISYGGAKGLDLDLEKSDDNAYRVRRYLLGVAEGQAEIPREQALPLEANMDLMGGIDFRKGCYVGQELTIRTRHRGVVRKRILPCLLYPSSPLPPEKLEYRPYIAEGEGQENLSAEDVPPGLSIGRDGAKGRSAGTWLRGVGNIGLALCRLQIMTDVELPGETAAGVPFDPKRDEFVVKWGADEEGSGGQSVKIKAFVPDWMRERLQEK
ncbi:hypothetical protein Daesc_005705 [Daldinia eschscholtzii]|uniref:Iron-sulfur cluster assembly factor IBA57 homolog, mitochondrial n=1 Tax=Daldinia eschscholtzii TaxID=292717 RepID=A0AAX6MMJ2_9PEZI